MTLLSKIEIQKLREKSYDICCGESAIKICIEKINAAIIDCINNDPINDTVAVDMINKTQAKCVMDYIIKNGNYKRVEINHNTLYITF